MVRNKRKSRVQKNRGMRRSSIAQEWDGCVAVSPIRYMNLDDNAATIEGYANICLLPRTVLVTGVNRRAQQHRRVRQRIGTVCYWYTSK